MSENKTKINWFPGHMKKALELMKEEIKKVDVILYVLDSRAPKSCLNPSFDAIIADRPVLYIFNKFDLADQVKVKKYANFFKTKTSDFVFLNSTQSGAKREMVKKINALCKDKFGKFEKNGIKTILRAMIIGVPNTGKSTLTNNLCEKAKAVTGNKAGVTKDKQWFRLAEGIEICDTPGSLYPNLSNQENAKSLAFIGSIKMEILNETEIAEELILRLSKLYPNEFEARYNGAKSLEDIGKKRGYVLPKGEIDVERTAKAILQDFRDGRVGKLTIEEL